jgi:hypothetical protein
MKNWDALARDWWSTQLHPPAADGVVAAPLSDERRRQVEAEVARIVERAEAGALPPFLRAVVESMPEGESLSVVGIGLVEEAIWHNRELTAAEVAAAGLSPSNLMAIVDALYPEDRVLFESMPERDD